MTEAIQQRLMDLTEERNALVEANAHLARQLAAAKGQITKLEGGGVANEDVQEVFDHWVKRLGKNGNTALGPARTRLIRQALKAKSKEEVLRAIDGLAARPCTARGGRCPAETPGSRRFDDIKYALSEKGMVSEERIETYIGYADETDRRSETGNKRTAERAKEQVFLDRGRNWDNPDVPRWHSGSVERTLEAFEQLGLKVIPRGTFWMAQCPAHDDRTPSLSVREAADGRVMFHCFAQDCKLFDIKTALGLTWAEIGRPQYSDPDWEVLERNGARAVDLRQARLT